MMRDRVTVLAPAKLNLALDVVGILPGGYHALDMTMQAISLYERVVIRRSPYLDLTLPGSNVKPGPGNTAIKAALAFFHYTGLLAGADITIYKNVPVQDCDGEIERMRNEYNMRRRLVVKSFNDMGLSCFEPRGAFYAFPCIKSSGMSSEEFCTKLLEQKHVAIIPGNAFGASGEGYARVSYAYSVEHLMEAIRRIREFLNENCK